MAMAVMKWIRRAIGKCAKKIPPLSVAVARVRARVVPKTLSIANAAEGAGLGHSNGRRIFGFRDANDGGLDQEWKFEAREKGAKTLSQSESRGRWHLT
jgi:hypothetical protein